MDGASLIMKRVLNKVQLLELFTSEEATALIVSAASGNSTACDVLMRFIAIERVESDSPILGSMLLSLVQMNIITADRRAIIASSINGS